MVFPRTRVSLSRCIYASSYHRKLPHVALIDESLAAPQRSRRSAILSSDSVITSCYTGHTSWIEQVYIHLYSSNDSNQRMLTNEKTNNDNNNYYYRPPGFCLQFHQILTDFQTSFTAETLSSNFQWSIPPNPKGVATLPCEILTSETLRR